MCPTSHILRPEPHVLCQTFCTHVLCPTSCALQHKSWFLCILSSTFYILHPTLFILVYYVKIQHFQWTEIVHKNTWDTLTDVLTNDPNHNFILYFNCLTGIPLILDKWKCETSTQLIPNFKTSATILNLYSLILFHIITWLWSRHRGTLFIGFCVYFSQVMHISHHQARNVWTGIVTGKGGVFI